MKIGVVMPVILQQPALLELTLEAVRHLTASCDRALYIICNGLHICTEAELGAHLRECFTGPVAVINEPGVVRSVAGSWNEGVRRAIDDGAAYIAAVANDVLLRPDGLDRLVDFGESGGADLWSGISHNNRGHIDSTQVTDGADFSCFMFRPDTIRRFGWFDTNFKPAYFEDNDYYARVVLGGGLCRVVHAAQFYHHGSMTIRVDPVAAHHVNHWFGLNQRYFSRKWGVSSPAGSSDEILAHYYRHPFNDPAQPITWFPEDGNP
jgi:GT2 family glycosyltransferase